MTAIEQSNYLGMLQYVRDLRCLHLDNLAALQNYFQAAADAQNALSDSTKAEITPNAASARAISNGRMAYLYLLKRTLTRYPLLPAERLMLVSLRDMDARLTNRIVQWGMAGSSRPIATPAFNPVLRSIGMDWPDDGETMIGLRRLDNLEQCITTLIEQNVPGDLMETGVWRGGASIFMRGVLQACGDKDRKVWLADSFQGLPKPDAESYPVDRGDDLWTFSELAIPLDAVKANFALYGLLDEQVRFLPGWFRDTLPTAPVEKLALLRLDGDMYESTMVALRSLYLKVSPGGFVIVDDYHCFHTCKQAVDDFRAAESIVEPLRQIDWTGVYWQVNRAPGVSPSAPLGIGANLQSRSLSKPGPTWKGDLR